MVAPSIDAFSLCLQCGVCHLFDENGVLDAVALRQEGSPGLDTANECRRLWICKYGRTFQRISFLYLCAVFETIA